MFKCLMSRKEINHVTFLRPKRLKADDLEAEKIGFKLALFDLSSMLIKPLVK